MSIFKKDSLWGPDELYYTYDSIVKPPEVEKIIIEVNELYKTKHQGRNLLTYHDGMSTLPPKCTLKKIINGKGSSGGIGKPSTGNLVCNFSKPANIRHELLHVLGFEHETFHNQYKKMYRIFVPAELKHFTRGGNPTLDYLEECKQEVFRSISPMILNFKIGIGGYEVLGERRRRASASDIRNLNIPETGEKSKKYKLNVSIKSWSAIAIQYDDAIVKCSQNPSYHHTRNPDNGSTSASDYSVMMYDRVHTALRKTIDYYNIHLGKLIQQNKLPPGINRNALSIEPLWEKFMKPDAFSANEKAIIINYGLGNYPQ